MNKEQSGQQWLLTMHQARNDCRKALRRASVEIGDPTRALWPLKRDRPNMSKAYRTAAVLNASVLDYHEHVGPFRGQLADTDIWTEQLYQCQISDDEKLRVRLGKLREHWADEIVSHSITVPDGAYGKRSDNKQFRLFLPVEAARIVYEQLNEAVRTLKLAVDIEPRDKTVQGPEDVAGEIPTARADGGE